MKNKIIMGIDTSNYTTSVALLTVDGELLANIKYPLPVKSGECGLRQSDAVFAHVKNIPLVMRDAKKFIDGEVVAIGVSERPRNVEGSYMPCFLSGVSVAEGISAASGAKLYKFSHQCGHIMAALYSSHREDLLDSNFCAFHVSGGTTEMLKVSACGSGFSAELIGGTADLNAGQVIDRIGVHMGLNFPAGKEMEMLAKSFSGKVLKKKPSVSGLKINLSGLENMAVELYRKTNDKSAVAAFVFDYISRSLEALITNYEVDNGKTPFVFAGGVMSNAIIKENLKNICDASFAEPEFSADNAVGIAVLTARAYNSENK